MSGKQKSILIILKQTNNFDFEKKNIKSRSKKNSL
jgi:hypothetical protein